MKKRILALLLACVFLAAAALTPVSADGETDRIINQINATFARAKELSGRSSFYEWCTEYVKYQLLALGITSTADKDIRGNGTQMYYYVDPGTTSTGYKKIKYEGSNCIYEIIADHPGMNVYNILVSWWHGYRMTDSNPGNGHVMFIHAIIDGYIYYSESYKTGDGILEGQPRISSIEKFYSIYNDYYGHAVGAVLFYGDIPAHVHNYKFKSNTPATCTASGADVYTCTICGAEDSRSIPALGHDFETVVNEPSCSENGYSVKVCKRCGEKGQPFDTVPALGHDFEIVTVEPACTESGSRTFICSRCGESRPSEEIPALETLGLPPAVMDLTELHKGIVLVTGETGSGKSTTLAALLDHINHHHRFHIVTLEDPVEYIYHPDLCAINQREVGKDTKSFSSGLRASLREDPNVILIGEMRDRDTIETAITAAETGHLVFGTLHTGSAADAVDRIVQVFPEGMQTQIRLQLSMCLVAVLTQQLVPKKSGGRALAAEFMIVTDAIRNLIRAGNTPQIANAVATSAAIGGQTMDQALVRLVRSGEIEKDVALHYAHDSAYVKKNAM